MYLSFPNLEQAHQQNAGRHAEYKSNNCPEHGFLLPLHTDRKFSLAYISIARI